ncbi:hypothetical protein GSI_11938 [Ganoderma sinense ZZ0214-1]|uniref:Uncharacterized protein n=1 Tax=Ganoderma sinense ZZ0214-1 TaxID=1077348 RepID=A0A2G8RXD5_9APHY|nr:hypothetical protein GSI_11938 [Ganoderma sinense ZZ0214-1]
MDLGLENVHVLITEMGARVAAHYNTKSAPLEPLVEEFGPDRIHAFQADLTSEDDVKELFSKVARTPFGVIQVAVINHAYYEARHVPLEQMSLAQWESTFRTNVTASFLVAREYLRALKAAEPDAKEKAAIVFVGSTAGKFGEAGHADYAATKSALMYGMCLSLKNEIVKIAPRGRVNVVAPGWTRTPMAEESLKNPDIVYQALATTPLKKVAMPEDVAHQIVVLSSSTVSGHVSGHVLMVEGGMEGRLLNRPGDLGL